MTDWDEKRQLNYKHLQTDFNKKCTLLKKIHLSNDSINNNISFSYSLALIRLRIYENIIDKDYRADFMTFNFDRNLAFRSKLYRKDVPSSLINWLGVVYK